MTLALSTSSPLVSVALFDSDGVLVSSAEETAPRAASGTAIRLALSLLGDKGLASVTKVAVDIGPGSFTGVKVGLTIAKAWGYSLGVPVAGVTAFDLVASTGAVALPSKKGEFFYRSDSGEVSVISGPPPPGSFGYGFEGSDTQPVASRLDVSRATFAEPMALAGFYVAEPSVSQAKKAHIMGETFG